MSSERPILMGQEYAWHHPVTEQVLVRLRIARDPQGEVVLVQLGMGSEGAWSKPHPMRVAEVRRKYTMKKDVDEERKGAL
jgi:hypothetical protein